jgi:hypothetical protein
VSFLLLSYFVSHQFNPDGIMGTSSGIRQRKCKHSPTDVAGRGTGRETDRLCSDNEAWRRMAKQRDKM